MEKLSKKLSKKERIIEMSSRVKSIIEKSEGIIISGEYENVHSIFKIKCKEGHETFRKAASILCGHDCTICSYKNRKKPFKGTLEVAKIIAEEKGGKCLSLSYDKADEYLKWQCSNGHVWDAKFYPIKGGRWCPICKSGLSERLCRFIFESITKKTFPTLRPEWLINSIGNRMELDGYSEDLRIAFEYNGRQHYKESPFLQKNHSLSRRMKDDKIKKKLCKINNVHLITIPYTLNKSSLAKFIYFKLLKILPKTELVDYNDFTFIEYIPWNEFDKIKEICKSKDGECLSTIYTGGYQKLNFICKEGHEWQTLSSSIKKGYWCPICRYKNLATQRTKYSVEKMIEFATSKGGFFLDKEYFTISSTYRWKCKEGHEWMARGSSVVIEDKWCRICAINNKRLSLEEINNVAISRGGECLSSEYNNCREKLTWRCKEGHEWKSSVNSVILGDTWCPECYLIHRRHKK